MSTKIYYGLRVEIPSGRGIWDVANDLRSALGEASDAAHDLWAATRALELAAESPDIPAVLSRLLDELRVAESDWSHWLSPAPSVVLLPYSPDREGYLLALPFGWCVERIYSAFLALPGVESWGYWNNVDPPDDVDVDAFEDRWEVWKAALGGDGWLPPSKSGLTLNWPFDIVRLVGNARASLDAKSDEG